MKYFRLINNESEIERNLDSCQVLCTLEKTYLILEEDDLAWIIEKINGCKDGIPTTYTDITELIDEINGEII